MPLHFKQLLLATRIAGVLAAPGGQIARVINAYATKDKAA